MACGGCNKAVPMRVERVAVKRAVPRPTTPRQLNPRIAGVPNKLTPANDLDRHRA